jgi:G:T-mismatch repair DNA endonuclease (very short patch repair protein)
VLHIASIATSSLLQAIAAQSRVKNAVRRSLSIPISNYITKINSNMLRDQNSIGSLQASGWIPLFIWECEIREENLDRLYNAIVTGKPFPPLK